MNLSIRDLVTLAPQNQGDFLLLPLKEQGKKVHYYASGIPIADSKTSIPDQSWKGRLKLSTGYEVPMDIDAPDFEMFRGDTLSRNDWYDNVHDILMLHERSGTPLRTLGKLCEFDGVRTYAVSGFSYASNEIKYADGRYVRILEELRAPKE